jgi:hypothetical protein
MVQMTVTLGERQRQKLTATAKSVRPQYSRDAALLKTKHDRWRRRYADQWIAIFDGKVYGPAKSQDELLEKLHTVGLPAERAVFHYFSPTRRLRIV